MNSWRGYTRNPDGTLTRIVTDHGPSHATIPGHRGSLVVGAAGPTENERARKRVAANQATSTRYRARHPDRVNEYQRDYRARLRAAVQSERSA